MKTYDLIAQENESFDHFNTGWLWMKKSQTTSDAWEAVLQRDLKHVSRDQNNFNEVCFALCLHPDLQLILSSRRYSEPPRCVAARLPSLVSCRLPLLFRPRSSVPAAVASPSSPTLLACRASRSMCLTPECSGAITSRLTCQQ